MTASRSFLFTLWDGGGNVPPALSVARALVARGHDVRVLADVSVAQEVAAAGARHLPWRTAPQRHGLGVDSVVVRDHEARTPVGAFAHARDDLMVGPAARFAADVRAELASRRADVLVSDAFLFGALVAGEAARVPVAGLAANLVDLPGWGAPAVGPGWQPARGPLGRLRDRLGEGVTRRLFDRALPVLNAARAANGLEPLGAVIDQFSRLDRLLILSSRALEFDGYAPPPFVRFTGPRLDDPAWAGTWTPPAGDGPLVLASLSSTYMQQLPALQRIAVALGTLPVRGLITTGPAIDPAAIQAPPNVTVVAAAPHAEVLEHASAVVHHGGHGTLIKALMAGVPSVVLPFGRDQLDNAARLTAAGAGLRLRPSARAGTIATAIRRTLDDPGLRDGARRLAAAIAADGAEDLAVAELEALAARPGARTPALA